MSIETEAIVGAHRLNSLAYTVIKAIVFGGYRARVYLTEPMFYDSNTSNFAKRIFEMEGVVFPQRQKSVEQAGVCRAVILQLPDVKRFEALIENATEKSPFITVITLGDRNTEYFKALRKQKFELLGYRKWLKKIDRFVYKDGYFLIDIFVFMRKRSVLGFDPHSSFLHDEVLFSKLHEMSWLVSDVRPISVNFIGCLDPNRRRAILRKIKGLLVSNAADFFRKENFWLDFTDDSPGGLPPDEFLDMLRASDFTLAPTGYSLVTHRPVEAMLCGSIPILCEKELDLYGFRLRDGENCIAVRRNDWLEAVRRAARFGESDIAEMRRNVESVARTELQYSHLSMRIRERLGLSGI